MSDPGNASAPGGGFNEERYGKTRLDSDEFTKDDRIARVLSITEKLGRGKLVDLGCTDGFVSALFKRQGFYVIGLDASPGAVEAARQRCDEAHVADGNTPLPLADNSADVLWAGEILEHVFYTERFLDEIRRVLKPGGTLVLSTPNLACWANRICLLFGLQPFYTEIGTLPSNSGNPLRAVGLPAGHIRVFTASSLKFLLRDRGFEVKELYGAALMQRKGVKLLDKWVAACFPSLASDLIAVARKRP